MYCPFCGEKEIILMTPTYTEYFPDGLFNGGYYYCRKCTNEAKIEFNPLKTIVKA